MSIDTFKKWAGLAPLQNGPLPDGDAHLAFKLPDDASIIMLMFDSNGRVSQIDNASISGGTVRQITDGRTAVVELMDKFGTEDLPPDLADVSPKPPIL